MSGRTFLLQDWVTIRSSLSQPFIQDPALWLDLDGFSDATVWIDVTEVTPPGGALPSTNSLTFSIQTAPTCDDAYFVAMAPALTYGNQNPFSQASATPLVMRSAQSLQSNNLMRYLRWSITPVGGGTAWDLTFRVRVVATRSTTFVPTLLSGCLLWLRADIGIGFGSGGVTSVGTWKDQSGNNNDASQGTGTSQPIYNANGMNGLPAINGDGADFFMTTPAFTVGPSMTMFAAVQPSISPEAATYSRILEWAYNSTYYLGVESTATQYKLIVNDNVGSFGAAQGGAVTAFANTIVSGSYTSPTGSLYVNGSFVASDTFTAPAGGSWPQSLYLMQTSLGGASYWAGLLGEVIVFNRALSASELRRVHRYLGARYGVKVP